MLSTKAKQGYISIKCYFTIASIIHYCGNRSKRSKIMLFPMLIMLHGEKSREKFRYLEQKEYAQDSKPVLKNGSKSKLLAWDAGNLPGITKSKCIIYRRWVHVTDRCNNVNSETLLKIPNKSNQCMAVIHFPPLHPELNFIQHLWST